MGGPAAPLALASSLPLRSKTAFTTRAGSHGKRSHQSRGTLLVRAAGAFTKLIEIPVARGVARALMVPARRFMDGADAAGTVLDAIDVRVPDADARLPLELAPLIPLSGYDVGEVPFVMQAVMYYRDTLDVGVLERALRDALAAYPLLAGRLDLSDVDASRKGVRLTNDGVPLRVVRSELDFDALPGDFAAESRAFLDYEPWIDVMLGGAPVFTAKVTQLRNGGSALGVCMSHAVSDGQGFVEFLVAWSLCAAGRAHPLGDPVFDRALLPALDRDITRDEVLDMLAEEKWESRDPVMMLGKAVVAGRTLVPDFLRFPPGNRVMIPVRTLVPIRPCQRGERRSLRTLPGVSLRPGSLPFNPRHRRLSTPLLTPFNSTPTFARMER